MATMVPLVCAYAHECLGVWFSLEIENYIFEYRTLM